MNGRGTWRWTLGAVAALCCLVFVALQVHRVEDALARSGVRVLGRALGDDVVIGGTVTAHALPRPRLVLTDVHVHDPDGSADLDIPVLEATQSLRSLLAGHLTFSQIRLSEPTATVDADRLGGDALHPRPSLFGHLLPGRIVVTGAVVAMRSSHPALNGLLDGFNGEVEGLDRNGSAALTGRGTWRGQHLEVSAHVAPFFDFLLGRDTTGDVKAHTPALTASVEGHLHRGLRGGFEGDVSVAIPSLAAFLGAAALPTALGQVVKRVSFSGSGVANADNITFSNTRLVLDDTPFEGSLAWQPDEGHGAWTGTFATDTLDLTQAFGLLPQARAAATRWSDAPWHLDPSALGNVDLRVSSGKARIGPVLIEDAAFSALSRNGRIEASLSEARSFDGLIRGRAVATLTPHAVDLKLDVLLSQMELQPLSLALGQARITGTASGHFAGEAHGWSAESLMESLDGRGQISVRQGSLPEVPSLAQPTSAGGMTDLWRHNPAESRFDLVTADLDVKGDHVGIQHGHMVGADLRKAFSGQASLLNRSFTLVAADGSLPPGSMAMNLAGSWDPVLRVTRAALAPSSTSGNPLP